LEASAGSVNWRWSARSNLGPFPFQPGMTAKFQTDIRAGPKGGDRSGRHRHPPGNEKADWMVRQRRADLPQARPEGARKATSSFNAGSCPQFCARHPGFHGGFPGSTSVAPPVSRARSPRNDLLKAGPPFCSTLGLGKRERVVFFWDAGRWQGENQPPSIATKRQQRHTHVPGE